MNLFDTTSSPTRRQRKCNPSVAGRWVEEPQRFDPLRTGLAPLTVARPTPLKKAGSSRGSQNLAHGIGRACAPYPALIGFYDGLSRDQKAHVLLYFYLHKCQTSRTCSFGNASAPARIVRAAVMPQRHPRESHARTREHRRERWKIASSAVVGQ